MSIKLVLFDLDGTLLPMDQDLFTKIYFSSLAKKLSSRGYEPNKLIESVWIGTKAMIKNTGELTNEEVFWNKFTEIYGEKVKEDLPYFDEFYQTDFDNSKVSCGFNKLAKEIVDYLKLKQIKLALATNPIFPKIANQKRIDWAGLSESDFEIITTYENSNYCKPNPLYYKSIIEKLGVNAEDCLMVGIDISEDIIAGLLNMQTFLLTDCLINKNNEDISNYNHGTFEDLLKFLEKNTQN